MKEFSLILPSYNQGKVLAESIAKVKDTFGPTCKLIIVDDGSIDETEETLKGFKDIRILKNRKKVGKGYSVKRGMLFAKESFRIFTDADLPYGVEGIERVLKYLEKGFDIVIGKRKRVTKLHRYMTHILFNHFVDRFTGLTFTDTQCGLKGFKGEVAERIFKEVKTEGFAFDVEVLYLATLLNHSIYEVEVRQLSDSPSTITMADALKMLADVKRIKKLHR